ncbi:MAG: DcuS/MalK family sensor histidine kinase [Pelosinus sp.]|nr:DcuS/MalK family sensor histidine kinase [Pelosinus sp.]
MMKRQQPFLNLQQKIILLVCGVVVLALLVTNFMISSSIAENTRSVLAAKAMDTARIVARDPVVIRGLSGERPADAVQNYANEIREITDMEFVVVMDMNGIRKSHPNPEKVGKHFAGGDESRVFEGQEYVSSAIGTLGPSVRAFTPVYAADGRQIGAISVGILENTVRQAVGESRMIIYLNVGLGFLVGIIGAILLVRNIKKTLLGLEPFAIAKVFEERSAMLDSVREGILAIDCSGRITMANNEAMRLLHLAGVNGRIVGQKAQECVPNSRLSEVLQSGKAKFDQEQDLNGIIVLTNRVPVVVNGEIVGALATFRDKTEVRQIAEQLTGVRNYAEALRAQTHEFMNKLHVILGLVRMESYDQLISYVSGLARAQQAEVNLVGSFIKDPVLAGFMLGKLSRAREAGVEMTLLPHSFVPEAENSSLVGELVTVLGNILDNALDAVQEAQDKCIEVELVYHEGRLSIQVADSGNGMDEETKTQIFTKGYSNKGANRGFGLYLVARSVETLNGSMEVISAKGQGTQFNVELPYAARSERI